MTKNLKQSNDIVLISIAGVIFLCIGFYFFFVLDISEALFSQRPNHDKLRTEREQRIGVCIQTFLQVEPVFKAIPLTTRRHCEYEVSDVKAPNEFQQLKHCVLSLLLTEPKLITSEEMVLCFCQRKLNGDHEGAKECLFRSSPQDSVLQP